MSSLSTAWILMINARGVTVNLITIIAFISSRAVLPCLIITTKIIIPLQLLISPLLPGWPVSPPLLHFFSILTNHFPWPISDWRTCHFSHESSLCEPHYLLGQQPESTTHMVSCSFRLAQLLYQYKLWVVCQLASGLYKLESCQGNVLGLSIQSGRQACVNKCVSHCPAITYIVLPCFASTKRMIRS